MHASSISGPCWLFQRATPQGAKSKSIGVVWPARRSARSRSYSPRRPPRAARLDRLVHAALDLAVARPRRKILQVALAVLEREIDLLELEPRAEQRERRLLLQLRGEDRRDGAASPRRRASASGARDRGSARSARTARIFSGPVACPPGTRSSSVFSAPATLATRSSNILPCADRRIEIAQRVDEVGILAERALERRLLLGPVALDHRVAVQLERVVASRAAAPCRSKRAHWPAADLSSFDGDVILQREELGVGAVDLGGARDGAGLHVDEARVGAHARPRAGTRRSRSRRRPAIAPIFTVEERVQIRFLLLEILLGEHLVQGRALDHAQPRHVLRIGGDGLADRLADRAARAREL